MSTMPKRKKYTPEYRAEAVRLVEMADRPLAHVARDLGVRMQTLWQWVNQASAEQSKGGALTTAERQELSQLRREVARLREEREILKKATAFFAKENV